jgi:hypothetical protein
MQDVEDPLDAGAVQIGDDPDEFLGTLPGYGTAGGTGSEQRLDPITRRLNVNRRVIGLLGIRHSIRR